jgi:hypothetical protein
MMDEDVCVEESVKWLAGETEVLGENLLHYHFVHHKSHISPGLEPGTNRLSYGTPYSAIKYTNKERSHQERLKLF